MGSLGSITAYMNHGRFTFLRIRTSLLGSSNLPKCYRLGSLLPPVRPGGRTLGLRDRGEPRYAPALSLHYLEKFAE